MTRAAGAGEAAPVTRPAASSLTVRTAPLGVVTDVASSSSSTADGVGAGTARRRPGRDLPGQAGRRERVRARGREPARGQLAVGVVAVAVRAPARVAALDQAVGRVVGVLEALAVGGDDRGQPARGVALVARDLRALGDPGDAPGGPYSNVTGASAPAAAGSPTCSATGRPRASNVVVFSRPPGVVVFRVRVAPVVRAGG